MGFISSPWLLIALGANAHTHTQHSIAHAYTHTDVSDKSNFKKPDASWLKADAPGLKSITYVTS